MSATAAAVLVIVAVALVAGIAGIAFGIVVLAPRISRAIDRAERDDDGDRPD